MFSILNVTTHIPRRSTKFNEVETDMSMISFYSQTLEIISKFLKEVGCQEKQSLCLLQEYIRKIMSIKDNSQDFARLTVSRMNFLDDLRFLIMSSLKDSPKEDKKSLKTIHSVLHLIALVSNTKLSPFCIINTWLNSNCLLNDEDDVLHAMRGNIGNLMKLYPENREAFEELAKIGSHFRNKKISFEKYVLIKDEWIQNYRYDLPYTIRNILTGKLKGDFYWTELLCYKLAYGNKKRGLYETLEEIEDLIPENDEIYFILTNNHKSLIKKASAWTKLVYCLLFKFDSRVDIYESILEIGNKLLNVDWQVALDYFSFTAYSNYYFGKIITGIEMNPVIFDFLSRYANRNNLDTQLLFKTYASSLLKKKDFFNYLIFINSKTIQNYEIPVSFVGYLLENLNELEIHFTETFLDSDLGRYLKIFSKLKSNPMILSEEEVINFVDHQYTSSFIAQVLNEIIAAEQISEMIIIKILDLILHRHKDLLLDDKEINLYKIRMIEKLHYMNQNRLKE